MPHEPHTPVDVLILTALKEEYDAVLEVNTGACPGTWDRSHGPHGFEVAFRSFQSTQQGQLRVAVTRALEMGGPAAVSAIGPLLPSYAPRCLAMSGVCAGREGAVELGDVIIADLLWNYEAGKLERMRKGSAPTVERFSGRRSAYSLNALWKQRATRFQPDKASPWLAERPRPYQAQMEWVLECLLEQEDPAMHPQRQQRCAAYTEVMERLRQQRWIFKRTPRLTKRGERHIQERRGDHPDGLPEPKDFKVHVGPLATGNKLQRGPGIFEKLSQEEHKVLGLEMEASDVAAFAHQYQNQIQYCIVMKGVMDFADHAKNDYFKPFAARASAECLLAFLRENLEPRTAQAPQDTPAPRISEEALTTYKAALVERPGIRCLDLRGLVGITPGPQQTELELLEFAVAPSLQDASEGGSPHEEELQLELRDRELPPARRDELRDELERLQSQRWEHEGVSGNQRVRPISFAEALFRYKRLVVIGDPGAGKSILTRLALLACAEDKTGEQARRLLGGDDAFNRKATAVIAALRELLPVHLSLGKLGEALAKDSELSLEQFIHGQLRKQGASPELLDSLRPLLTAGRLFLLCDGLDEVSEALRKRVVDAVTRLIGDYPALRLLLTSRPHGYRPRVPHLEHARLAPLNPWQQRALVSRLHLLVETRHQPGAAGEARARHRTSALLRAIQTRPAWRTLSSNPLLLTLSALTRTSGDGVPRHQVIVFENFTNTLLMEWRSVAPVETARGLLKAWATVASELVRQDKRHGLAEARLLRMLATALGAQRTPAALSPKNALWLALETGLVRKEEETVSFWHSTFAEFLAAYELTREGSGAAERILQAAPLPPLVLRLAAARLQHALDAHEEVDELARKLLARDESGPGQLLCTGLREVSDCLADGVTLGPEVTEQIWATWAERLQRTPPSLAWASFEQLTLHAPPSTLSAPLVERFARMPDRGLQELKDGLPRLVARLAMVTPEVTREMCTDWLRTPYQPLRKLYGALGLASIGDWSEEVINVLGQFGATDEVEPETVGRLVSGGGRMLVEQLRVLVRPRLPGDEPPPKRGGYSAEPPSESAEQKQQRELRLSAACLLAVAGEWDDEVARVLRLTIASWPSASRVDEAARIMRHCATGQLAQRSLLDWSCDDSNLGTKAREIVLNVAPLIEDMPQAVLERAAGTQGEVLGKLEELLTSVGLERRSLLDTLWVWLEHPEEQRRLRATRILRRFVPHDERLHEALRRGLQSSDVSSRPVWAQHSFGLNPSLAEEALTALQACARSPEPAVRQAVYEGMIQRMSRQGWSRSDGWLACASDPSVPAAARLDAAQLMVFAPGGWERVKPILYTLLDAGDATVRREAAFELLMREGADARATAIAAEEAAQACNSKPLLHTEVLKPFATEVVQAILRGLPRDTPPKDPEDPLDVGWEWNHLLTTLASKDLSSLKYLLQALQEPGMAGDVAEHVLCSLADQHQAARDVIRERLPHVMLEGGTTELLRLVRLGFSQEQTTPLAVQASRALPLHTLSPSQVEWLAGALHQADAKEDSARLWRSVLAGAEDEIVLKAATALIRNFPDEAGTWLDSALARLVDSADLSLRVDAARLGLLCGVHEEKALTALTGCLESGARQHAQRFNTSGRLDYLERCAVDDSAKLAVLEDLHLSNSRVDLMVMKTLYIHRPSLAESLLERWLGDEELPRFRSAVKFLPTQGPAHKRVHQALAERVGSASAEELEELLHLATERASPPEEMMERLLTRFELEPSLTTWSLNYWTWTHPEVWAYLQRQVPARHRIIRHLLESRPFLTRDTIACAVEFALSRAGQMGGSTGEIKLKSWCQQSPGEPSRRPLATPDEVQGWLRDVLCEHATPTGLEALLCFDRLAALAGLPTSQRLQPLSRALELDFTHFESEFTYEGFLRLQASAALLLVKLKHPHERILPILREAFHALAGPWAFGVFDYASALLTLQPDDVALRQTVLHTLLVSESRFTSDQLLLLLEQAGLSREERISVICVCLGVKRPEDSPPFVLSAHAQWIELAPKLFSALESLGCSEAHRKVLLHEFVSAHGAELLPHTQLTLIQGAPLSPSDTVKSLLRVIAEGSGNFPEVTREWLTRLASRQGEAKSGSRRATFSWPRSLSDRLDYLIELSQVDDPALVDRSLVELAGAPVEHFLPLYEQARKRAPLSNEGWSALRASLELRPEDDKAVQLSKEWLTLGLWRVLEPSTEA